MAIRLYLGCSSGTHIQHQEMMERYGPLEEWEPSDKYVIGQVYGKDIQQYDAMAVPYADDTVDTIYNSHLLEHLPHVVVPATLKHWHDKLKPGGELIINVPDLEWLCVQTLRYCRGEAIESQHYNKLWGEEGLLHGFYGSQSHAGEYHKSGYTKDTLQALLAAAGFVDIDVQQVVEAHDMGVLLATCRKHERR